MTASPDDSANDAPDGSAYWRRNLWVAVFGSVTTLMSLTLLVPFLPFYVEELGVHGHAAIVQWSGIAFAATFCSAAVAAPLWGYASDRYGRKLMLVRASLGMAVFMSLIGVARNVYELVGLRFLGGAVGGYASAGNVLVAAQTPRAHVGWALGVLSSGVMAGSLIGPLIGGMLAPVLGIRNTFFAAGALIFVAFLATVLLIKEDPRPKTVQKAQSQGGWRSVPDRRPVVVMLVTGFLVVVANFSVEPIIAVYVAQFATPERVTFIAGLAMSAAALGSILSASWVGRRADRVGHWKVLVVCFVVCALLILPQAFVVTEWQLIVLRFLMGLALGGMLPCVISVIRHSVPQQITGQMIGLSTSAQFLGAVLGPVAGGFVGGHIGIPAVFIGTSVLMVAGALMTLYGARYLNGERA